MERIEKTVFLSYRRTDFFLAHAVFQDLTHHGFDVFIDFDGLGGGDFERVILENIRARAHFVVLLTPSALKRCGDATDWLRHEIETALDSQRNIVPLMLEGFDFGKPQVASQLTGKLIALKNYNGLRVPSDFFEAAMERLRERYLNVPLNTVLHRASITAQEAAKNQQAEAIAAAEDQPEPIAHSIKQKSMETLLAECRNNAAVEFFKEHRSAPTNIHKNALAFRQAGKNHWMVWPTKTGAAVLQIDRFNDDETLWENGLSSPNIKHNKSGGRDNFRFDLMSLSDFAFFVEVLKKEPMSWVRPQRIRASSVATSDTTAL